MIKNGKVIVSVVLLLAVFGFLAIITEMPTVSASEPAVICNQGTKYYCWVSDPNWDCGTDIGGVRCTAPPKV